MKKWIYKRPPMIHKRPTIITGVAAGPFVSHDYLAVLIRRRSIQPLIRM